MGRYRERWAGLDRPDRVLWVLVASVVLLRVVLYPGVAHTPVYGDEAYYVDGGRALSNLVRDLVSFSRPDGAELGRDIVGNGWFMPGMSLLLAPLFVVFPHAPVEAVRAYIGLFSLVLLLLAVLVVRRHVGRLPAAAVLVMPGLVPIYALFGFSAYGDLVAGLFVVVLLTQCLELVRRVRAGTAITWRHGVDLGLLGIAAVYFRSSVSILVVGVVALTAVVALVVSHRRGGGRAERTTQWRGTVAAAVAAGVAFLAVLAPWSAYASHELGGRVLTTTSVPTVLANTFGDRSEVCYGECDPGSSIWFSPLRYSREVARATGISEMDAATEMSTYARTDVTAQSYAQDVLVNLSRYLRNPAGFSGILEDAPTSDPLVVAVSGLTYLMVFPAFLVGLAMLLVVVRRSLVDQVWAVLLTVAMGALLVQPFVHIAGSRYWVTLGPLLGLSGAALWAAHRSRDGSARAGAEGAAVRWLSVLQAVLAAAVVLVAAGVVALAL